MRPTVWAVTVWLVVLVLVLCALASAWTAAMIVRDESPPSDRYFALLGVLLLVLVAQLVAAAVALLGTDRDVAEPATFGAYLVTVVLVLPFGAALALVERSRWGNAALLIALLTVAAMETRLDQIWRLGGA